MHKLDPSLQEQFGKVQNESGFSINTRDFVLYMDKHDELASYREKFHYPKNATIPAVDPSNADIGADCVYMCGNSLGLCPKSTSPLVEQEMKKWQECGVVGHYSGHIPWATIGDDILHQLAGLVGAKPSEVVLMNTLSVNLHFLMVSFYQPTAQRHKVIVEGGLFPSDYIAVRSQIQFHDFDADESMIAINPRPGENILRTEDILLKIEEVGDQVALIMFSGVQFYTGQCFDMKAITAAGHAKGCRVGFDLAHAVGNVELKLNEWNVDFACWCSYKYMNGGPGAVAGAFVHEKHAGDTSLKRLEGWWGVTLEKRFEMENENLPLISGAMAYAVSNPPVLSLLPVSVSLRIFHSAGMDRLLKKQRLLTGYLEYLLHQEVDSSSFEILTPKSPRERGCQLSVSFQMNLGDVFKGMEKCGVVCDMRRSHVLRIAPCPLYNTFVDVHRFVSILKEVMGEE